MKKLLEVIGVSWAAAVPQTLANVDIWTGDFVRDVRDPLRAAQTVCTKWLNLCTELTGTFWNNSDAQPWTLGEHSHTY